MSNNSGRFCLIFGLGTRGNASFVVVGVRTREQQSHPVIFQSVVHGYEATNFRELTKLSRNLGFDGNRFDILRGDNKREVRERLREVADLTAKFVVILFREKT